MEKRNSQLEHGQPMQLTKALFARATQVWLAVNHNNSITHFWRMSSMIEAYCTGT